MLGNFRECVFMRSSRVLGSCAGLMLAVLPVQAAPAAADPDPAVRAREIMGLTYQQFATTPHEPPFEWSADGCSAAVYDPDMTPACNLHDFGYRNFGNHYALKLSPTRETKNWIDARFGEEMDRICKDKYEGLPDAWEECHNHATIMLTAVQQFGDSSFF
jgi:Prokaryotic phospholipase A2